MEMDQPELSAKLAGSNIYYGTLVYYFIYFILLSISVAVVD